MSPVHLRGIIYMLLAALPVWIAWLTDAVELLLADKPVMMHALVWALLICSSLYQALLALRAFIDGTAERAKQEPKPTEEHEGNKER